MAEKQGRKPARRRKKRGMALVISYLIRGGAVAALLLVVWFAVEGIRLCADLFDSSQRPAPSQSALSAEEDIAREAWVPTVTGTVTIDPGHGGVDSGCGQGEVQEKDIALSISRMVCSQLEQVGITVVMTRQMDEGVSLDRRAIIANQAASDLFVSIHCNSFQGAARGLECYYYKSEQAQQLASAIIDGAAEQGIVTRQVQKNNYQVLWDTDMPAVLVETGFLSDAQECAALASPEYQAKVARAIAGAIISALDQSVS